MERRLLNRRALPDNCIASTFSQLPASLTTSVRVSEIATGAGYPK
jgi:hypothetical protein